MSSAPHQDIVDTRFKFYQAAKSMYPDVTDPGAVWVLTQVLGWDWEKLATVPEDGLTRYGYRVFKTEDGKRLIHPKTRRPMLVSRKWTKAEKSKLKDWFWLLNL